LSAPEPTRIAVAGPGRMGVGLAVAFSWAGLDVDLIDLKRRDEPLSSLERARGEFGEHLDLLASLSALTESDRETMRERLHLHPAGESAAGALAHARVVVEAVPERLEAKREAFALISESAPPDALLASTTSSFLVDALAGFVTHPERFLNTHWLNPAYLMPLVEVSPGEQTSESTHAAMLELLRRAGKAPVTCAASPGYIVPRLQGLVMNEAARMWEEGVASADDLDTAARLGFGLRFSVLGPIEFIDWGGVDTLLYTSRYLTRELGSERFDSPQVVADHVDRGATGMDSGQGLRDFSTLDGRDLRRRRTAELIALLRHLDMLPGQGERSPQRISSPPLTSSVAPVTKPADGEHR